MGTTSDLAIAIKASVDMDIFDILAEQGAFDAAEKYKDIEGTLFVWRGIKTNSGGIQRIADKLNIDVSPEDFIIVEAYLDCPNSDGISAGEWDDNPWDVTKVISANLSFDK